MISIDDIAEDVKWMKAVLAEIKLNLHSPFQKEFYNLLQVSKLCEDQGVSPYTPGHLRILCGKGLLAGARKAANGRDWLVPAATVQEVLNVGCETKNKT